MIPRIKKLTVLDDFCLFVEFDDGYRVVYDVKEDMDNLPGYSMLKEVCGLFKQARLDTSRTCVCWTDEIDLASDSIYKYGTVSCTDE